MGNFPFAIVPPAGPASGDLTGTYPGPTVKGISGGGALAAAAASPGGIGINTAVNATIAAVIGTGADNHKGLVVFANSATQSSTLIEAENASFTPVFTVDKTGNMIASGLASLNGGSDTSGTAAASAPSFTSGTAAQVNTTQDAMLYIAVTTVAALAVAIGPTSGTATSIVASENVALGVISLRIPKGWWVKITGTIADLTITAVTC